VLFSSSVSGSQSLTDCVSGKSGKGVAGSGVSGVSDADGSIIENSSIASATGYDCITTL
jgi:hypothetical protein